jgi:hypothetical protein
MKLVNLKPNFHVLLHETYSIWFSYETPIAYSDDYGNLYVSNNEWSSTTGKHLNYIESDKSKRIPHNLLISIINSSFMKGGE